MSPIRLDTISGDLAERYRQASVAKRRESAIMACILATKLSGLTDIRATSALNSLQASSPHSSHQRPDVQKLAEELDEQYFQLEEFSGSENKARSSHLFNQARAAMAIFFALSDDEQLHESLYEALNSSGDSAEMYLHIINALS